MLAAGAIIFLQRQIIFNFQKDDVHWIEKQDQDSEKQNNNIVKGLKKRNSKEFQPSLTRSFSYKDFECRNLEEYNMCEKDLLQSAFTNHYRKSILFLIIVCSFPLFFLKST